MEKFNIEEHEDYKDDYKDAFRMGFFKGYYENNNLYELDEQLSTNNEKRAYHRRISAGEKAKEDDRLIDLLENEGF